MFASRFTMKTQITSTSSSMLRAALSAIAIASLGACSTVAQQAKEDAIAVGDKTGVSMDRIMTPAKAPRVTDSADFYVSTKSVRIRDDVELLPTMFRLPVQMQINPRASIKDLTSQLSAVTGLKFAFAADVTDEISRPTLNNGFSTEQPLKSLLDELASQANVSWRFVDGSVEMYRYETKLFQVAALPGTSENITTLSNKNSSVGVGSTATSSTNGQAYKQDTKVDFWTTTDAEIKQMLTTKGKSSIAQSSGVITVTDTPQALNNVASYVKQINFLRSRNVQVNVHVYAVDTTAGQNFDLDFQGVLSKLGRYGMNLASPTAGVIQGAGSITAIVKNTNSGFNGSTGVLQALGTIGNVSEVDKFSMMTVTGEPAPLNSLTNEGYLAKVSVQQSTVAGGTPTTTLEPGTLTYGTSATLTPTLVSGTELLLRVALDMSAKSSLTKISSTDGGSSIQLPVTTSRSFVHSFNIKSGETLLVGFQSSINSYASSSIGDPEYDVTLLAGGTRTGSKTTRTLVYAITPSISASR